MWLRRSSIGNFFTRLCVLALGLLFLLPSAYKLFTYGAFRTNAIAVDGMIIDASSGRDLGSRPWVEFQDVEGIRHTIKSRVKTHWLFAAKRGEKIRVFYDRDHPDGAIVDSLFHYIVLPVILIAWGACFLFYGLRGPFEEAGD